MQKSTRRRALLVLVAVVLVALLSARLYLPVWLKDHVNAELQSLKGYDGAVEAIDVALYRGAYRIHGLTIRKTDSGIPVPFVAIELMDLSIEWKSLLRGRIVSEIEAWKPHLNFAVSPSGATRQTGAGVDWSEEIKKLMPIDINRVALHAGTLHYRNFSTSPQVDLYIQNMNGEITNLRNVEDEGAQLPSGLTLAGDSIGGGKFALHGKVNILKPVPDLDVAAKLEQVNLPALNNYFRAFAALDVEKGRFDLYSEVASKNGAVSGYIKPIARHIELIDLKRDSNPIKLVWESLASLVIEIFSNQRKDQFATLVSLEGRIDEVETSSWEALGGILRNAFVKAFDAGLERTAP